MTGYRPISKIGAHDPDLDSLHEDVPPWMVAPLFAWARPFWGIDNYDGEIHVHDDFIAAMDLSLKRRIPFSGRPDTARLIHTSFYSDPEFALDMVGFCLFDLASGRRQPWEATDAIEKLDAILHLGGSAWRVGGDAEGRPTLVRRDLDAAKNAISALAEERPAALLTEAWAKVATREPDPSGAYDKAVKAVEAAMHPVVSPRDRKATLGKMLGVLRDQSGWTSTLGDVAVVVDMADTLWTNHYRHGTEDRYDHTPAEADAAVHLAIPLVRYFTGGLVTRSS